MPSGERSARVAAFLAVSGFAQVYNVDGGIDAYAEQIDPCSRATSSLRRDDANQCTASASGLGVGPCSGDVIDCPPRRSIDEVRRQQFARARTAMKYVCATPRSSPSSGANVAVRKRRPATVSRIAGRAEDRVEQAAAFKRGDCAVRAAIDAGVPWSSPWV